MRTSPSISSREARLTFLQMEEPPSTVSPPNRADALRESHQRQDELRRNAEWENDPIQQVARGQFPNLRLDNGGINQVKEGWGSGVFVDDSDLGRISKIARKGRDSTAFSTNLYSGIVSKWGETTSEQSAYVLKASKEIRNAFLLSAYVRSRVALELGRSPKTADFESRRTIRESSIVPHGDIRDFFTPHGLGHREDVETPLSNYDKVIEGTFAKYSFSEVLAISRYFHKERLPGYPPTIHDAKTLFGGSNKSMVLEEFQGQMADYTLDAWIGLQEYFEMRKLPITRVVNNELDLSRLREGAGKRNYELPNRYRMTIEAEMQDGKPTGALLVTMGQSSEKPEGPVSPRGEFMIGTKIWEFSDTNRVQRIDPRYIATTTTVTLNEGNGNPLAAKIPLVGGVQR